jgi:hypothetical protein
MQDGGGGEGGSQRFFRVMLGREANLEHPYISYTRMIGHLFPVFDRILGVRMASSRTLRLELSVSRVPRGSAITFGLVFERPILVCCTASACATRAQPHNYG